MSQPLKLGQIVCDGERRVLVIKEGEAFHLGDGAPQTMRQIVEGCSGPTALSKKIEGLATSYPLTPLGPEEHLFDKDRRITPLMPIDPPEVWAVGVTYKRQAAAHDDDIEARMGKTERLYTYVYSNKRAEVFFKGFARSCRGPFQPLTLRADSEQVMPEAELVLLLGDDGLPIGYTLGNDLTAWDIEKECPLYLNQAKIWDGSGSIGPYIVPTDKFRDPYNCLLMCHVYRNDELILESEGSTTDLKRSIEELCHYLNFNNPVSSGSLLFTGTACVIPHDFALHDGDTVRVSMEGLGILENPVVRLVAPEATYPTR